MFSQRLTLVCLILSVSAPHYAGSVLEQQISNHFKYYLEEGNAVDGIEQFGGPFDLVHYGQTVVDESSNRMSIRFDYRQTGILGVDPNQLQIIAEYFPTPIDMGVSNIQILSQRPELFQQLKSQLGIYENEQPVSRIQVSNDNQITCQSAEKEFYCYGFTSIGPQQWQVFFRRGHRIGHENVEVNSAYLQVEEYSEDKVLLSSSNKLRTEADFLLFGSAKEDELRRIISMAQAKDFPIAAVWVDGWGARILAGQNLKNKSFKHPFLNIPICSIVLEKRDSSVYCVSYSKVQTVLPEGLRQTFNDPGILLKKPSPEIIRNMVPEIVWSCNEAVYSKYLSKEDMADICEIYLRLPMVQFDHPDVPPAVILDERRAPCIVICPSYSDFGFGLGLVKEQGRWQIQVLSYD